MRALGSAALNWQTCLGDFKGERGSPVSGAGSGQAAVGNMEGQRAGREPAGPRPPAERRARPQEAAGAGPGSAAGPRKSSRGSRSSGHSPLFPGRLLRAAFRRRGLPGCREGRREELPPSGSARPAEPGPPRASAQQRGGVRQENGYISREESLEVPSTEGAPVRL